jgi:hypothetical protein
MDINILGIDLAKRVFHASRFGSAWACPGSLEGWACCAARRCMRTQPARDRDGGV